MGKTWREVKALANQKKKMEKLHRSPLFHPELKE
jgi:hypothetical protein